LIIGDDIAQGGLETEDEKKWYNLLAKRIKEEYGADLTCKILQHPVEQHLMDGLTILPTEKGKSMILYFMFWCKRRKRDEFQSKSFRRYCGR